MVTAGAQVMTGVEGGKDVQVILNHQYITHNRPVGLYGEDDLIVY